jgi:hypothetical protein
LPTSRVMTGRNFMITPSRPKNSAEITTKFISVVPANCRRSRYILAGKPKLIHSYLIKSNSSPP